MEKNDHFDPQKRSNKLQNSLNIVYHEKAERRCNTIEKHHHNILLYTWYFNTYIDKLANVE